MQLNANVVGLGILGEQHVDFLVAQPEVKVTAVADIRRDRTVEIAERLGARAYDDYRRMFREETPDIAVIATPDPLHKVPVMTAIEAGVPYVIQEKPMATNPEDAEAMFEAAESANARIFVNFANRGLALDRATYYVIREGLLGEVVYGDIHLDDNISVPTRMWGGRSEEWAAGSSTAHFLLSHVVDFLHWVMAPDTVTEVYAITQRKVLGYTPDLYDAFLTFDSGAKFRVKAEWIKHIDGLVEFSIAFSGAEGSLTYIKRPTFGEIEGWRANLSVDVTPEALLQHQAALLEEGIRLRALVHRPHPTAGALETEESEQRVALEASALPQDWWRVARGFIDAILEETLTPSSWDRYGPVPTGIDGLRQTQVVNAIVRSAAKGRPIELR
ncbi:MAG: Gfo/Idh/MocA family protein [Anaerolineae bacterium]